MSSFEKDTGISIILETVKRAGVCRNHCSFAYREKVFLKDSIVIMTKIYIIFYAKIQCAYCTKEIELFREI